MARKYNLTKKQKKKKKNNKASLCITCGRRTAINSFYKECRVCIEEHQKNKERSTDDLYNR